MASETKHSAFPWRAGSGGSIVCDDASLGPGTDDADALEFYGGHVVCETVTPTNRDFIVRACHSHADLLAACEALMSEISDLTDTSQELFYALTLNAGIEAAIAKAKPKGGE